MSEQDASTKTEVRYLRLAELSDTGQRVLSVLLLLVLISYFTTSIHSPAVYWHLLLGSWSYARGALPRTNEFTVVGEGLEFFSGAWLFEVVLAYSFERYGALGALSLKLILVAILLVTAAALFARRTHSKFVAGVIVALLAAGLLVRTQLVPELYGYTFVLLVCEFYYRARHQRTHTHVLLLFLPVAILSANLMLMPVALCAVLLTLYSAASLCCVDRGKPFEQRRAARMLSLSVVLWLACLTTPYFGVNLPFVMRSVVHYVRDFLLTGKDMAFVTDYRVALLSLFAATFTLVLLRNRAALRRSEVVQIALLLAVSILSKTIAPYALIGMAFLSAVVLGRGLYPLGNIGKALDGLLHLTARLPAYATLFFLACLLYVSVVNLLRHPLSNLLVPAAEVSLFVEHAALSEALPLYHPAEIGGYVGYRFRSLAAAADPGNPGAGTGSAVAPELRAAFATQLTLSYPALAAREQAAQAGEPEGEQFIRGILGAEAALVPASGRLAAALGTQRDWCRLSTPSTAISTPGVRVLAPEWQLFLRDRDCSSIAAALPKPDLAREW